MVAALPACSVVLGYEREGEGVWLLAALWGKSCSSGLLCQALLLLVHCAAPRPIVHEVGIMRGHELLGVYLPEVSRRAD